MCSNMLYIKIDDDQNVNNYCKCCSFIKTDEESKLSSRLITSNEITSDGMSSVGMYMNPDIVHDPCLPHVTNIQCVNEKCTKSRGAENDVIFIKYDSTRMKYLYHCVHCSHFWKN